MLSPQLAVELDLLSDEGVYPSLGRVLGMVSLAANGLAIDSSCSCAADARARGLGHLVSAEVRRDSGDDLGLLCFASNTFRAAHVNF